MANAEKIRKTMKKQGIPEEIISQFDFPDVRGSYAPILPLVTRMDELLTHEQCLAVMQEQGCSLTDKAYKAFGLANAGKTAAERIPLLDGIDTWHKYNVRMNPDGTLSVWWGEANNNPCPCPVVKDLPRPRGVSKTHCACCGGHARHYLQQGLGVKLKLAEVVSSSVNSDGKERCEFLYEIEEAAK